MGPGMRTLSLVAIAGLGLGIAHFLSHHRVRGRQPADTRPADRFIEEQVREGLPGLPGVDVRVRNGIVSLRGTASPAERDRALTHALSIPGVRRVYSDLEDGRSIIESGAGKVGVAHPR